MTDSGADYLKSEIEKTAESLKKFAAENAALLDAVADVIVECLLADGTVFFAGNGGSASQAQHAAAELVGRFTCDRGAYRAIALTTDTSILTAVANDYGYERIFDRQLEGLAKPGDVFVALSTSGNSPNVLLAMMRAKSKGLTNVALTGPGGGEMAKHADYHIAAPDGPTWRIQEIHLVALHMLCGLAEKSICAQEKK